MPDMEQILRQLQETALVTDAIQSRHAVMLKDHGEWLQEHDKAIARLDKGALEAQARGKALDERLEKLALEARERDKALDQRIQVLVSAIGAFIASKA
jgi:hypothetical protein